MTLIVGINHNSGVLVCGDTRGSLSSEWPTLQFDDNIQKVYSIPPYIVGLAGEGFACASLLNSLRLLCAGVTHESRLPEDPVPVFKGALLKWYEKLTSECHHNPRVSCVIALADRVTPWAVAAVEREPGPSGLPQAVVFIERTRNLWYQVRQRVSLRRRNEPEVFRIEATVGSLLEDHEALANAADERMMLGFSFPGCSMRKVPRNSYLAIGSGSDIDEIMSSVAIRGREFASLDALGDIFSLLCSRVTMYVVESENRTVNYCMHGFLARNGEGMEPWGAGVATDNPIPLCHSCQGTLIQTIYQLPDMKRLIIPWPKPDPDRRLLLTTLMARGCVADVCSWNGAFHLYDYKLGTINVLRSIEGLSSGGERALVL